MRVVSCTFHVPKAGTTDAEYEDAAYPFWRYDSRRQSFRCAIADGATESSFAREWARALVRHFGLGTLKLRNFCDVVPDLQARWKTKIDRRPLPWFAQEAASRGAFAAFLGLEIRQARGKVVSRDWRALALGDACMFIVRADRLRLAFPLDTSVAFSNRPFLLSTQPGKWASECEAIRETNGTWRAGDEFYLATDALAQWFLAEYEGHWKPWELLRSLEESGDSALTFKEFVETRRSHGSLRNDDTTLIRVRVSG